MKVGSRGALLSVSPEDMDQDYKRRLLRQINHQNLPAEKEVSLFSSSTPAPQKMLIRHELGCFRVWLQPAVQSV